MSSTANQVIESSSRDKNMLTLIQQVIGKSLAKNETIEWSGRKVVEKIHLSKTLYLNECLQLKLIIAYCYHLGGQKKVTGYEEFHVSALIREPRKKKNSEESNRWFRGETEYVTVQTMVDDLVRTFGHVCRGHLATLHRIYETLVNGTEKKVTVKEECYLTFQTL